MRPLLVVPGLVRGLPADGGGDIFEGAVARDEPLVLRVWKLLQTRSNTCCRGARRWSDTTA